MLSVPQTRLYYGTLVCEPGPINIRAAAKQSLKALGHKATEARSAGLDRLGSAGMKEDVVPSGVSGETTKTKPVCGGKSQDLAYMFVRVLDLRAGRNSRGGAEVLHSLAWSVFFPPIRSFFFNAKSIDVDHWFVVALLVPQVQV